MDYTSVALVSFSIFGGVEVLKYGYSKYLAYLDERRRAQRFIFVSVIMNALFSMAYPPIAKYGIPPPPIMPSIKDDLPAWTQAITMWFLAAADAVSHPLPSSETHDSTESFNGRAVEAASQTNSIPAAVDSIRERSGTSAEASSSDVAPPAMVDPTPDTVHPHST